MTNDNASPNTLRAGAASAAGAAGAAEAGGALIWLVALAALAAGEGDTFAPILLAGIGLGATLATAGAAWSRLGALGRWGRLAGGLGVAGGLLIATGAWEGFFLGTLAVVAGTVLLGLSLLRGAERRPIAGLLLVAAGAAAFLIFGGRGWVPTGLAVGFAAAHLLVATLGLLGRVWPAPGARRGAMAGLAVGSVAAIAGMWLGAGLATGDVRLPSGVTASVRTGPLAPLPVVVDTDMQPDDWMALLYLASEPSVELRAVTVAGGSSGGCELMVGVARDLLADVGHAGVPVACGPAPAPGGLPFPAEWTAPIRDTARSLGWSPDDGDPPGAAPDNGGALALLRSAIAAGPLTIVSLGPPTNIAALLEDRTWNRRNVVRVVQMAGAVDVDGNVAARPKVEWNAAVDPGALATVLAGDVEVVLVSLDGTRHVPIRPADIDRLGADRSTRLATIAARILESQRDLAASGGYFAWDQLAAVVARQQDVVRLEAIPLRVSTARGEAGRTVRDAASGRPILVTVDADAAGFERILLDALLGRAR